MAIIIRNQMRNASSLELLTIFWGAPLEQYTQHIQFGVCDVGYICWFIEICASNKAKKANELPNSQKSIFFMNIRYFGLSDWSDNRLHRNLIIYSWLSVSFAHTYMLTKMVSWNFGRKKKHFRLWLHRKNNKYSSSNHRHCHPSHTSVFRMNKIIVFFFVCKLKMTKSKMKRFNVILMMVIEIDQTITIITEITGRMPPNSLSII